MGLRHQPAFRTPLCMLTAEPCTRRLARPRPSIMAQLQVDINCDWSTVTHFAIYQHGLLCRPAVQADSLDASKAALLGGG